MCSANKDPANDLIAEKEIYPFNSSTRCLNQQNGEDVGRACYDAASSRARFWYRVAMLAFLVGPGIAGVAIMGWLKTR